MTDGGTPADGANLETVPPTASLAHISDLHSPVLSFPQARPSRLRAWFYLVGLSLVRQARMRQMLWITLGLLGFTATFVGLNTLGQRWDIHNRRFVLFKDNERHVYTYRQGVDAAQQVLLAAPRSPLRPEWEQGVLSSVQAALDNSTCTVFLQALVLFSPSIVLNFLLPLWSLSFATDSIGGERENRSLLWLLTRPLPRPAIYLAKFVAVLPWTLGLNVGGFGLLCLLGGGPGRATFLLCWPAVVCATLAFSALFLLIGASCRRPAVVAIVYSFFLEIILGNMPGYFKRASISFYTRCMIYEKVKETGITPSALFLAVDGLTALLVLLSATVVLLVLGMFVFARMEYHEEA